MACTSTRLRPRTGPKTNSLRSLRFRRKRTVVSYRESSSESNESDAPLGQENDASRRQIQQPRASRRHARVSYYEDSAESDALGAALSQDDFAAPSTSSRIQRDRTSQNPTSSTPSTQTRRRKARPLRQENPSFEPKRQKVVSHRIGLYKQPGMDKEPGQENFIWDGKTMPWSTLPYHIWLSVFIHASYPLLSATFDPLPSIAWLVRVATTCKAFMEPALSALYYEPPIYASRQIPVLTSLLQNQNETAAINYRAKIRHLSIDSMISSVVRRGFLENIIPYVTQLRGIALGVHSDDPKLCRMYTKVPMAHIDISMSMYSILESTRTQLESWTWNRTLDSHFLQLSSIKDVHRSSPFQSLVSLTFIDFHLTEMVEYNGRQTRGEEALADTLSALPRLRKLQFSLADIVNEHLMPLLPEHLEILVLTSCYNLFSKALIDFLHQKGQQIKELVLSHNQSLSLSFLTDLSKACPRLESLKMNLLYYNSHTTFNDSAPRYKSLLGVGEQPSWPMSLRHLELYQLRKWKKPAAELFFSSLVHCAQILPNLRYMAIKASIDESSWRDRIAFRDKWVHQLKKIYLRTISLPNNHLRSIAAYKTWKLQQSRQSTKVDIESVPNQSTRQRSNVNDGGTTVPVASLIPQSNHGDDSDIALVRVRRSARAKAQKVGIYNESDDCDGEATPSGRWRNRAGSEDYSRDSSAQVKNNTNPPARKIQPASEEPLFVQGLCNVVDIVIDNLRPAEEQLHESDFLDEERSGDEDWNGDDDMDDGRYAW